MIVMHSDAYHSDAYELADEPFNESPASIDGDVPLTDIRLEPIEFKCPVLTKPFYNLLLKQIMMNTANSKLIQPI